MRRTKIVCTLGPACNNEQTIAQMLKNGMNVARLNFSHGTHEYHKANIEMFRKVRDELKVPAAIMLDTKGPEIRVGNFKNGPVQLKDGDTFTFTSREVDGNEKEVSITYKELPGQLVPGNDILVDDGKKKKERKNPFKVTWTKFIEKADDLYKSLNEDIDKENI